MTAAGAPAGGRPAIVLLSGGLDSTTTLAMATAQGFAVHALAFRYGQRHAVELQSAARVAAQFGARTFRIVDLDLRAFGGSALTSDLPVPKARAAAEMGADIPITYVPARNTLFLAFAVGAAEVVGARDVFIGANALDYSGYPDCRPEFLRAFETAANLGTKMGVEARTDAERLHIQAPLLALTKAQIIVEGMRLGVDYAQTWSCYDPVVFRVDGESGVVACGACDSCLLRKKGFAEAQVVDPTRYR